MVPIIQNIIAELASKQGLTDPTIIRAQIGYPLWWALALGACLGGNGTLIGASANILVSKIGEKNNCPITFKTFLKFGFPIMVQTIVICFIYLWLRYFRG
jgi:Na+/H+ antiporter NhaD/arsenite permease-like protein